MLPQQPRVIKGSGALIEDFIAHLGHVTPTNQGNDLQGHH
jgi:hypothetical protein